MQGGFYNLSATEKLVQRFTNNCLIHAECGFECSAEKNVGVAGYVEAFSTEQSDSQASV